MRTKSIAVALGLCAVMLLVPAVPAQKKATKHRTTRHATRHVAKRKATSHVAASGAETGLAGIKLYDSGSRVIAMYGSPDVIEQVTLGGSTAGPGGGAGGGARGGNLPGAAGARGGGPGGGAQTAQGTNPGFPGGFDFGGDMPTPDRQGRGASAPGIGAGGGPTGPPGSVPQGPPTNPGGGPGNFGGNSDRVLYTRWVYNRNASKFGFILDQWNHVVQCEAIGIQSGKARTRRGITFGSTFGQIIQKYSDPDGYEINGDNIVVRYLSRDKCAFRLNRLGENKPYVVTGIVVAAGKR